MPGRPSGFLRGVEWTLAVIGVALILWSGFVVLRAARFQSKESATLDRSLRSKSSPPTRRTAEKEHVIGRLEIPRIKLSVMVVEGDDDKNLELAAGHLPETPLPWEFGNSAFAGHRDSFFRPLRDVKINDRMVMRTRHGDFQYAVSKLKIVQPTDLSVLKSQGRSSLTLVTCYPFNYIGHAPKRFIVQADHVPS